jgi:predicted GTPase
LILQASILITGIVGSGKSSIIRAVFGNDKHEGTRVQISPHFEKYENDKLIMYDSLGLDVSNGQIFVDATKELIQKLQQVWNNN